MLFWIIDKLSVSEADTIWIAMSKDISIDLQVQAQLRKTYPTLTIKLIPLIFDTCGAAETLFIVCQSMNATELARKTVTLNCDTIYFDDILSSIKRLPSKVSACVHFDDDHEMAVYSYISIDESGRITDIKEKQPISNKANSGAYVFGSASLLKRYSGALLSQKVEEGYIGEYYTSAIILKMIQDGFLFLGIEINKSDFHSVATPDKLDQFLHFIKGDQNIVTPRRFCFDLDGTLVTMPKVVDDYTTCEPIIHNIQLVRELHKAGHHIIIQTARRMKTHGGNIGSVLKDIGPVTFATLEKLDIPYDEIFFGKPYAHVYVDDLAVNALLDTRRELGWLSGTVKGTHKSMIEPRSINLVQIIGDNVIKSSKSPEILGEIYFYSVLPDDIGYLFPAVKHKPEFITDTYSITLEKISGISFTHLLINRALTAGRLKSYLAVLKTIHGSSGERKKPIQLGQHFVDLFTSPKTTPVNIYSNYGKKLAQRFQKNFDSIYKDLGPEVRSFYDQLMEKLNEYESKDQGIPSKVIHGDPVFSNGILKPNGTIAFLDMRGHIDERYTTEGDCLYDLAKVYQSLFGYDFILLASESDVEDHTKVCDLVSEQDQQILDELQQVFLEFVKAEYGEDKIFSMAFILPIGPEGLESFFALMTQ
ncbi:hypothetical protein HDV02_003141 [Globomyces sp. JEL0801]|nr:hypothetical protein HDV02_003141 [Globomyces sp. JEL0801]